MSEGETPAPTPPPEPPEPLAKNGWRIGNRKNNGAPPGGQPNAGGPGKGRATKRTYDPKLMAEAVAEKITTGKKIRPHHRGLPLTEPDAQLLNRIANESVEVFNDRIALNLREIADLATQRIKEKLQNDEFKTSELGFILSVAHDKRLSLDGSRALQQSNINVLVVAPPARDQMLSELEGLSESPKTVTPA